MRNQLLMAAAAGAALLAGCTDHGKGSRLSHRASDEPVQVAERLDCPDREGDLRLVSAAGDGRACAYRGEDGAEVELRLASNADLKPLEAELATLVPAAAAPPEPPSPPEPPRAPDEVAEETGRFAIPGIVDVRSEGERASIRLPGVRIEAEGDNADIRIGGRGDGEDVRVRAHEGGAEVRVSEEEHKGDVQSTFLLTSEKPGPKGWRVAGYQARGSGAGPLVVGVIRARGDRNRDLMDDVEDLLERNVEG